MNDLSDTHNNQVKDLEQKVRDLTKGIEQEKSKCRKASDRLSKGHADDQEGLEERVEECKKEAVKEKKEYFRKLAKA